ncbi:hypothetical protein BJ508DRAFT_313853 [Ascobolus immersus RN42]|uniref:Uncharacterized protein n=1 Tax=Ascobolus immersus RN42 TaxID=1160509 RepID=A0A3N4HH51_ASCIM|nr:hypothetical protein BJ508DRAFT_313853 [Ascobolus immersus RN42]
MAKSELIPQVPPDYYPATVFPPARSSVIQASYDISRKLLTLNPDHSTYPVNKFQHSVARPQELPLDSFPSFPVRTAEVTYTPEQLRDRKALKLQQKVLDDDQKELGDYVYKANRYLLDGWVMYPKTAVGRDHTMKPAPDVFRYVSPEQSDQDSKHRAPEELVRTAVKGMLWVINKNLRSHGLKDGHLRTAVLCGFEFLAPHGYSCKVEPVWMYAALSTMYTPKGKFVNPYPIRESEAEKMAREAKWYNMYFTMMEQRILQRSKYIGHYTPEQKQDYIFHMRAKVKELPVWTELLFEAVRCFSKTNVPEGPVEAYWQKRRLVWRWLKKRHFKLWEAMTVARGGMQIM